jgi:hypothetical protein
MTYSLDCTLFAMNPKTPTKGAAKTRRLHQNNYDIKIISRFSSNPGGGFLK